MEVGGRRGGGRYSGTGREKQRGAGKLGRNMKRNEECKGKRRNWGMMRRSEGNQGLARMSKYSW